MKYKVVATIAVSAILFSCVAPQPSSYSSRTVPSSSVSESRWDELKRQEVTTTTGRPLDLEQALSGLDTQNTMVTFAWNARMFVAGGRAVDLDHTARSRAASVFDPRRYGLVEATRTDRARFIVHADIDMNLQNLGPRESLFIFRHVFRIEDQQRGIIVGEDTFVSEQVGSSARPGEPFHIRREWLGSQTGTLSTPGAASARSSQPLTRETIGPWSVAEYRGASERGRAACTMSLITVAVAAEVTERDDSYSLCLFREGSRWSVVVSRDDGLGAQAARNLAITIQGYGAASEELRFFPVRFSSDGTEVRFEQPEVVIRHMMGDNDIGYRDKSARVAMGAAFNTPDGTDLSVVFWEIDLIDQVLDWVMLN